MNPLVLIVGPTGSGKSALGLKLAEKYQGAVLNCDSLQAYQRLDIGTAKPPADERRIVPHHLFDFLPPGEVLTAGDFRKAALDVLAKELPKRIVFGVGGSGFYIQALEKGMFDVPKPDPAVEAAVRAEAGRFGMPHMFKELEKLDFDYADRISPNDSYRILRALIIIRDSGKKVTDLQKDFQKGTPFPYPLLKMGLLPTREELLPRVTARTRAMLDAGLVDEVRALLAEGHQEWPALFSVGYKECVAFLKGEISREKLPALIVEKTMQLAKKRKTWFKRDSEIHWLPFEHAEAAATDILARFLDSLP
jgi:tRNA dimethylallyltransferase